MGRRTSRAKVGGFTLFCCNAGGWPQHCQHYIKHCTLHTAHYTLHTTLHITHSALLAMCTLLTLHCSLLTSKTVQDMWKRRTLKACLGLHKAYTAKNTFSQGFEYSACTVYTRHCTCTTYTLCNEQGNMHQPIH